MVESRHQPNSTHEHSKVQICVTIEYRTDTQAPCSKDRFQRKRLQSMSDCIMPRIRQGILLCIVAYLTVHKDEKERIHPHRQSDGVVYLTVQKDEKERIHPHRQSDGVVYLTVHKEREVDSTNLKQSMSDCIMPTIRQRRHTPDLNAIAAHMRWSQTRTCGMNSMREHRFLVRNRAPHLGLSQGTGGCIDTSTLPFVF
jgi:hypothetical protein